MERKNRISTYLTHYEKLKQNANIPLYLRIRNIPTLINLQSTTEELWKEHTLLKQKFETDLIQNPIISPQDFSLKLLQNPSFLDLKIELAHRMLQSCEYCENQCHMDRTSEQRGFCGVLETSFLSSAFLHMGEEEPLIPSGTIFFAGCSFDCQFCQNEDISTAGKTSPLQFAGIPITPEKLGKTADQLVQKGANNINYVGGDPTPNLHTILESMRFQTHHRAQIWNSNFYNSIPALELLSDVIDLWLPDFKYGNNECAHKYSRIPHYWDIITRNFEYIRDHGTNNIIIRHLIMPNHIECCSKPILRWIKEHLPSAVVNNMAQYHPSYHISGTSFPELNRRVSAAELSEIREYAKQLGLHFDTEL
jgi:putative pyruvate formate lyase activating enzyme